MHPSRTDERAELEAGEERSLLRRYAAGDRGAGEELVESTYHRLYGALVRLTGGDVELAADLTQETYRKAWKALPDFRGEARLGTWLYRIAYTTYLNHLRRPRPMRPFAEGEAEEVPARDPVPAAVAIAGEEFERVRRAVLELPDDLRFTVSARYWQGLRVKEIARIERVTPQAIRKRLTTAYGALRLAMEDAS